jgi:hypothetical protein
MTDSKKSNYVVPDESLFYFKKSNGKYYMILENDPTNELYIDYSLPFDNYKCFEALRCSETHEALIEYKNNFKIWNEELLEDSNGKMCFNQASKNSIAVFKYFNYYSKASFERTYNGTKTSKSGGIIPKIEFEKVNSPIEFKFIESCNNGGLRYVQEDIINVPTMCYGHDFAGFYPRIMGDLSSDFRIPFKGGLAKRLTKLVFPENMNQPMEKLLSKLKLGIYRVSILSEHPDVKKVFNFSRDNFYTTYDILFAYQYKDMFNFTINLIVDGKVNAYIYDTYDETIFSRQLYNGWYNKMMELKKKYPKNKLVKHLSSSLHGSSQAFNKLLDQDDFESSFLNDPIDTRYKIIDTKTVLNEDGYPDETHYVIDTQDPYKYPYARLKCFLVSYGRTFLARYLIRNELIPHVLRIYTDGIVLDHQHEPTEDYAPLSEDKTTGTITWLNATHNTISKAKLVNKRLAKQDT